MSILIPNRKLVGFDLTIFHEDPSEAAPQTNEPCSLY